MNQRILRYLAAVAIAVSAGDVDPAPRLEQVPENVLADVVGELDGPDVEEQDRWRMLALLSGDIRPAVHKRVARAVNHLLDHGTPFERVEMVAEWATAQCEGQRAVIADVLAQRREAIGDLALEHLAVDPSPLVRQRARRARRHGALTG